MAAMPREAHTLRHKNSKLDLCHEFQKEHSSSLPSPTSPPPSSSHSNENTNDICHQTTGSGASTLESILTSVTLSVLSITLIYTTHLSSGLSVLKSYLLCTPFAYLVYRNYKGFLSLGPGGTPSTFLGYLKISYLRLYALPNPYQAPETPGDGRREDGRMVEPEFGYFAHTLTALPTRKGLRPTVAGVAPQRQQDQFPPVDVYFRLRQSWLQAAATDPGRLETLTSCFEKRGLALFAQPSARINETCRGEIAHVHVIDGSLHLSLHLSDVAEVVEKGWGQRHPLAGCGPGVTASWPGMGLWRILVGTVGGSGMGRRLTSLEGVEQSKSSAIVPEGFTLLYAPRDESELKVVSAVVEAGAWWVMGRRLEIEVEAQNGELDEERLRRLMTEAGVERGDRVPGLGSWK